MNNFVSVEEIAQRVLSMYLQSWGFSIEQMIGALNSAVRAAGIDAEFRQDQDGKNAGWYGSEASRAAELRRFIDTEVWCGDANEEIKRIEARILEERSCSMERKP